MKTRAIKSSMESTAQLADRNQKAQNSVKRLDWGGGALASSLLRRYGSALMCVVSALVITLPLQRFFQYPFLFLFFAAVMASAWFAGTGAGLFAVLVSTIVVDYFFVPPF